MNEVKAPKMLEEMFEDLYAKFWDIQIYNVKHVDVVKWHIKVARNGEAQQRMYKGLNLRTLIHLALSDYDKQLKREEVK